jgi:teichoic acid transport system permease protein
MSEPASYSDVEYVFEPHSEALPDLGEYLIALWDRRAFMVELARADLRAANASTSLGALWNVLDPVFQGAIYFFLFSVLRSDTGRAAFLPVLLGGIFLFQLTAAAFGEGGGSVRRGRGLVLNSTFPRALLPVTAIYKSLRSFVPIAAVFVVLFPLVGGEIGAGILVLPLLFCLQVMMNIGIALFVSTVVTLVPDANNAVQYVTRVLFFATPIVYPATLLPDGARMLVAWQPLFALFTSYQAVFSGGTPEPALVAQAFVWSVVILVIGGRTFLRHERELTMHL